MPHWRDHFKSDALGAYSLWSDEKNDFVEKDGIITHMGNATLDLGQSGKQSCYVAFTNLGKPMKVNKKISKQLAAIIGSHNLDNIKNLTVTFWVDKNERFGSEKVEALRVKACVNAPIIDYSQQIAKVRACQNGDELIALFKSFNTLEQVATMTAKDEMKQKFGL